MWENHGDGWGHMSGGGWFLMSLGMLLMVVIAVAVTVLALRSAGRGGSPATATAAWPATDRAAGLLRERLARGEIDEEDYQRLRRTLDQ